MCLVGNKRAEIAARVLLCENNFCTEFAHQLHFCGLQKLNTLNLCLFHPPLNPRNHFSTVLIKTNWYTISYKYYNCSGLTSITIPNSVTIIGYYAFQYCSFLTDVYCLAEIVPITASNAFNGTPINSATLYVPESAIEQYPTTEPWSGFGTFVGLTQDMIDDIKEIKNEELRMKNEGEWYDLSGRQIVNGKLPRGIYINGGKKVVVK